jgi:glyoxylase-like metal-dependent hydrolase (beta-lactamase superfamily II)
MDLSKFLVAASPDGNIRFFVAKCGHIDTNTGFIVNIARGEAVLIDAPFGALEMSKNLLPEETKVSAVLFTHGHWDHIGNAHIFKRLGAKTYAHRLDKLFIEQPEVMAMFVGIDDELVPCKVDVDVNDNDSIQIGDWLNILCRWVPGHAAGDLIFYIKSLQCVFTGDTLFQGCIGRSDLPGGDGQLLIAGIKEKILTLPDDTLVIPGHGNFSTIGAEKLGNEYLLQ